MTKELNKELNAEDVNPDEFSDIDWDEELRYEGLQDLMLGKKYEGRWVPKKIPYYISKETAYNSRGAVIGHGELVIKIEPKIDLTPTNFSVSPSFVFSSKDEEDCIGIQNDLNSRLEEYNPTSVVKRSETDPTQFVCIINDLSVLTSIVLKSFDAIELSSPNKQFWVSKRISRRYRFWKGGIAFFNKMKSINSDDFDTSENNGIVSKRLIYISFLYYFECMLLSKAMLAQPEATWKKIIKTRNTIVNSFKKLREDDIVNDVLGDIIIEWGPDFDGSNYQCLDLQQYHGDFSGGLSPGNDESLFSNYGDFFKKKWPVSPY